jgi:hypothetical protein
MTVQVTFAGINYDIPDEDDSGWSDLTSYLVALAQASVGTTDSKSFRIATSSPVAISSTEDYAVGVNVASASSVVLPSGTTGQIVVVFDASGASVNNNITITCTGGQTINGLTSYVIRSNRGAVTVQFGTSGWYILSAKVTVTENNQTNLSVIDATNQSDNTGVLVANLQASTITFIGSYCQFVVSVETDSFVCACSSGSNIMNCLSDTASKFLATDAGTGFVVTKSSNVITFKNRSGGALTTKIRFIVGQVSAATAWS